MTKIVEVLELPEAPASVNVYLLDPTGNKVQWTLRDHDESLLANRYSNLMAALFSQGWRQATKQIPTSPQNGSEPELSPKEVHAMTGDKDADVRPIPVEEIEREQTPKGKDVFKIRGGNFTKYGITMWPEALPQAYAPDMFEVGVSVTPQRNWIAHVLFEDDKPKKVVRLEEAQDA